MVIVAVAGVTLAATTLLGVTFQGSGSSQTGDGSKLVGGPLLTANRDRLAICVEAVEFDIAGQMTSGDPALEALAKSRIEDALTEVAKHPRWEAAGLAVALPLVDLDCPSPPSVFLPGVKLVSTGKGLLLAEPAHIVEEASYYRTFVFIVSREKLAETFAGHYPLATQEWLRRGDNPAGVTTSLYLSPEQLQDLTYLTQWLTVEAGLEAVTFLKIPVY